MGLGALPDLDIRIGDVCDVLPALADEVPYDLVIEDVYYRGFPAEIDGTPAPRLVDRAGRAERMVGDESLVQGVERHAGRQRSGSVGRDAPRALLALIRKQITQRWFNELIAGGVPKSRQPPSE